MTRLASFKRMAHWQRTTATLQAEHIHQTKNGFFSRALHSKQVESWYGFQYLQPRVSR
ncbi:uncharacterized protein LACBIDRAFT_317974 [Laccaria bicolor S238N-H82]|uniref:Predicted protein n=1 Tax=Laccaria bicolor (strain S238N-H82 / ATCC MYA-4686) TaxID=486041 RepID=B0D5M9_LACBS|nr:uncharacterized protein LACBIDRAFT_317974 [Laccaria bicolor S238N-H82]EDR09803.1 predicted protein [Laccaria bicolor S238N-H82]|eukprot:XP_001879188.1 predicted protein [Laccaria bicolor S238N-H82]